MRDQVRVSALSSFGYFANYVLASGIPEENCEAVQQCISEHCDAFFLFKRPRVLAVALRAWLESLGITVVSEVTLPRHEILSWLDMSGKPSSESGVALNVVPEGVSLEWL